MDPIVTKLPMPSPGSGDSQGGGQSRNGPASKFAQLQLQMKGASGAPGQTSAQGTTPVVQAQSLDGAQSKGLGAAAPQLQLQKQLAVNNTHMERLKQRIAALPKTGSTRGLENRLLSVEHQYQQLDSTFRGLPPNPNPMQLVELQQKVYNVSESVNTISKLVDQATSTVKTVLQTQV